MANPKIKAGDVLGDALKACGREKEVMLLLAALMGVVFLIGFWPLLDTYSLIMVGKGNPEELVRLLLQDIQDNRWLVGLLCVAYLFVAIAVSMVWTRVCVLGRGAAFAGGPEQFLRRTARVFWRTLCAVGWILLFMGLALLPLAGLSKNPGAGGQGAGALVVLSTIALAAVAIAAALAVSMLTPIAVHGEARDIRVPIHRAFGLMRGNLARAAGLLFLVVLAFEIGLGTVFAIIGPAVLEAGGWFMLLGNFLLAAAGVLVQFLIGAYGAYFAVRVVPALRG